MFEKEKQAIIDCPDDMIKVSDLYHLLDTAKNENLITKEQFKKWNEVLDYIIPILVNIIPILVKGAKLDSRTAKCGFILTRDMWWNNEFIVYVVKRLASKYEIDMEE